MGEEVKKPRRPIDPNSAKYKLNQIVAKQKQDVWDAKERGEKIGWCASNFPVEIIETLGLYVCYPENHGAVIGAKGGGERMCSSAEGQGYSNDLCAYARINFGYLKEKSAPEEEMPMPDYVLCCNNICDCMFKWYENLARECNIPLFFLDIPYNQDYEVSEAIREYVKGQWWDLIAELEEFLGKKWDDAKFREAMYNSKRSSQAWLDACYCAEHQPSPFNGFDLMNHMAVATVARGKKEAYEAFELLITEYKKNIQEGTSTYRVEEKYRIMFEGIACWPYLRATSTALRERGINMVSTIYAPAFAFIYDDFDGLIDAYCTTPNGVCLEHARDLRADLCKKTHTEGLLVHTNRSCKAWSGSNYEMTRQVGEICGIPVVAFDGDQADPRNFSEAQYVTRVQGLQELMDENKKMKEEDR